MSNPVCWRSLLRDILLPDLEKKDVFLPFDWVVAMLGEELTVFQ